MKFLLPFVAISTASAQYSTHFNVDNTETSGGCADPATYPAGDTCTTTDFRHQYTQDGGGEGTVIDGTLYTISGAHNDFVPEYNTGGWDITDPDVYAAWYPNPEKEDNFINKQALTCSACKEDKHIRLRNFWEGNRFGHTIDSDPLAAVPTGNVVLAPFVCKVESDADCEDGYHAEPLLYTSVAAAAVGGSGADPTWTAYNTCVEDLCNDVTDCNQGKSGVTSANRCWTEAGASGHRNNYKYYNSGFPAATTKCICANNNMDPEQGCAKCKDDYSNYPYCNHKATDFDDAGDFCLNDGTLNADYWLKNAVDTAADSTMCGGDVCGPTQHCCAQSTGGYYQNNVPYTTGRPGWVAVTSADENARCESSHRVCCGTTTCAQGTKCLDPKRSQCATLEESAHIIDGYEACWGGDASDQGALLNNGTAVRGADARPTTWCAPWETCCNGVCCGAGSTCEDEGEKKPSVKVIDQDYTDTTHGWDPMYTQNSGNTLAKGKFCTDATGPSRAFDAIHAMHIVVLPLFLTFGLLLGAVLTLQKSGAPPPVKILAVVSFVVSILELYHHSWRSVVVTCVLVAFVVFACNSGHHLAHVAVWLSQLLLLMVWFDLQHVAFQGQNFTGNAAEHDAFATHRPTGPSELETEFFECVAEYDYFYTDVQENNWDWDRGVDLGGGVYVNLFHGYCEGGWLATIKFFQALHSFLLLAIIFFSNIAMFSGGASTSNKVSADAEVP